ncbi:hypothetical protein JXX18_19830, partial [Ruthenibacterium lactatiformans]
KGWQAPSFSICIFPILPGPLRVSAVFWHLSTGPLLYIIMLFLIDVDHGSFEKAKETRQINLQAATVSLQVVISLCKRKETAALKLSFKTAD